MQSALKAITSQQGAESLGHDLTKIDTYREIDAHALPDSTWRLEPDIVFNQKVKEEHSNASQYFTKRWYVLVG
jgi:hypothetical protein